MNRKYSFILLLFLLIALYTSLNEVVMPFVMDVVKSDAFLEDTDDIGDMEPVSNQRTMMAAMHCNSQVREELDESLTFQFPSEPENVWNVGNATYVVSSYVDVTAQKEGTHRKRFACQIHYEGGDDTDFENWDVLGIQI